MATVRLLRGVAASGEWLIVLLQLVAVVLLLGLPNPGEAGQYFAGHLPTERATVALAALCVWVVALALVLVWMAAGVRRLASRRAPLRHTGVGAVLLGLCLLGFGLVHSLSAAGYTQCCGSVATAGQLSQVSGEGGAGGQP